MASTKFLRLSANPFNWSHGTTGFTNWGVGATNAGIAWAFSARDGNAITHLGFRYGARTGTPPTYVIALESLVAATGVPDGTVLGGGSPASATFTPPADTTWDSTWQWVALSNSYTPTVGQILCITIRYSSGTVDGSNYSSFTRSCDLSAMGTLNNFPSLIELSGGSWTKRGYGCPPFGVRSATTRYGTIIQSIGGGARTASTVGHRQALRFTLPANATNTYTVRGMRLYDSLCTSGSVNPIMGLWSSSSTLQTVTLDGDWMQNASATRVHEFCFDESSLTPLSPGTVYYCGLEVANASNAGVWISNTIIADADDGDAYPGGANDWCISNYNGSSWTDSPTVRPSLELILDDMTQQAGGSGGYVIGGN